MKIKNFFINKNVLFWISLALTILFVFSPLVLQIPILKYAVSYFFQALTSDTYKSSFIENIGNILGTVLTITGTLLIQKKIDERTEKENQEKEDNDVRRRIIIIYYDFKLAFEEIAAIYNFWVISSCLPGDDSTKNFYDVVSKYDLYIDDNWIRNVASLHDIFDENLLKDIFMIYGDICSIRLALKSNNHDKYQMARIILLLNKFYTGIEKGKPQLESEYIDILKHLKFVGKITDNSDN